MVWLVLAAATNAAEVDVKLKDGSKVTGAVLFDNDQQLVIIIPVSNGVLRKAINKADIAEIKEHDAAVEASFGPKDRERLQKKAQAAEDEARHREKGIVKAQDALDDFIRDRAKTRESAMQRVALDKRQNELRIRAAAARTQTEIARSKLNALYKELDAMNRKMAEPEQRSK